MKIENQVCTLEQGKRLKELGLSEMSFFGWFGDEAVRVMDNGADGASIGAWLFVSNTTSINNQQAEHREDTGTTFSIAPAFNVAELGLMLPFTYSDAPLCVLCWKHEKIYGWCVYENGYAKHGFSTRYEANEAQARAAMLIYLIENNLVKVAECNQRLLSA